MTEIHNSARLRLEYTDLLDDETLREFEIDITGGEPLDIIELAVLLTPLPMPHAGSYVLRLLTQDGNKLDLLGSHRLRAIEREVEDE